ncbi:calcium-binding protein [Cupriavidus necator]|uniref:calcium-binding protein n=1 Tax=Cupriavidus necator TaxID=106590 RepID=UPI003ECE8F53
MAKTKLSAQREHRIEMKIVVDAYTEDERALSWHCYLKEQLSFPFKASVREAMDSSPLPTGEHVLVTGLAHEDLCRVDIFVWVRWGERDVVAPLAQIDPVNGDKPTRVAVADGARLPRASISRSGRRACPVCSVAPGEF